MFIKKDIPRLKQDLTINVNLLNSNINLKTRWGVFSPRSIDEGTLLLLKHLTINENDICIDLGCGYGPIGIAIAKSHPNTQVHMLDKDFVAVELSNINAKINNSSNAKAYLSDAFSHVDKDIKFNHIISNVPAKVGREQLSIILYDAYDSLDFGGKVTFVFINGLKDFMKNNFKSVFGNYKKLKQGKKYIVACAIKK